jgi:hypothetical protein
MQLKMLSGNVCLFLQWKVPEVNQANQLTTMDFLGGKNGKPREKLIPHREVPEWGPKAQWALGKWWEPLGRVKVTVPLHMNTEPLRGWGAARS